MVTKDEKGGHYYGTQTLSLSLYFPFILGLTISLIVPQKESSYYKKPTQQQLSRLRFRY